MAPVWKAVLTLCGLLVTTVESSDPVIDLGYAVYRGARDSFFGLNTFKGFDVIHCSGSQTSSFSL